MGVMACDRNGCENVMCDHFSPHLQMYICIDCLEELKASGLPVKEFMNTPKEETITSFSTFKIIGD